MSLPTNTSAATTPTHTAARLILLAVLLVTPWCFGGVFESTQVYIFAAITGTCACWLIARHDAQDRLPLVVLPLLAGVLLGLLQLCPLPTSIGVFAWLPTVELQGELLDLPSVSEDDRDEASDSGVQQHYSTLSLRPASTRNDLSLLVLSVGGLLLGSVLFCSAAARLLLCWSVALNGAILTIFALLQKLTWNGQLYWFGPSSSRIPYANFVNKNNAGGYLNLCLGATVVLMLWAANRRKNTKNHSAGSPRLNEQSYAVPSASLSQRLSELDGLKLGTLVLAAIIVGGILCTLSRGAVVALVGSGVATAATVFSTRKKQFRTSGGLIAVAAGAGLVVWVGFREALLQRLETLTDSEKVTSDGRIPNWLDSLASVPDFWPVGSGLGTYRDIYLLYQQRFDSTWYYYAENQYIQALVEGGIPALLLLLFALTATIVAISSLLRSAEDPFDYAFAVGCLFTVISQAIHSFFDFGLYLPANLLLMSVLCGAFTQRAATQARSQTEPRHSKFEKLRWLCGRPVHVTLMVFLLLGLLLATRQINTFAQTKDAFDDADYSTSLGQANEVELRSALERMQARLPASPDEAELHYEIAKAWMHLYRIQTFEQLRRTSPNSSSLEQLWDRASTSAIHKQVCEFVQADNTTELNALRNNPLIVEHLRPAHEHLLQARQSCPILSKIHLRLAKICFVDGAHDKDAVHLQRARRLAPSDSYTFLEAGLLDLQAGRVESACASWRHVLSLSEDELDDVIAYAIPALDFEKLVELVLPPSPDLLLRLARQELPGMPKSETRPLLLDRIESLANAPETQSDERHRLLGAVCALRGDLTQALAEYDTAVRNRPLEIDWRYEYGQLLLQARRFDDAREQIRWCSRQQPKSTEFRRLLEEIRTTRSERKPLP